jgi:hypothetical protein
LYFSQKSAAVTGRLMTGVKEHYDSGQRQDPDQDQIHI